jgi:hypothetical protein
MASAPTFLVELRLSDRHAYDGFNLVNEDSSLATDVGKVVSKDKCLITERHEMTVVAYDPRSGIALLSTPSGHIHLLTVLNPLVSDENMSCATETFFQFDARNLFLVKRGCIVHQQRGQQDEIEEESSARRCVETWYATTWQVWTHVGFSDDSIPSDCPVAWEPDSNQRVQIDGNYDSVLLALHTARQIALDQFNWARQECAEVAECLAKKP